MLLGLGIPNYTPLKYRVKLTLAVSSVPDKENDSVPVMISRDLYNNIEKRTKLSGGAFKSVEEYIQYVLTEVVKEDGDKLKTSGYTDEEEEEVKDRLNKLGYI